MGALREPKLLKLEVRTPQNMVLYSKSATTSLSNLCYNCIGKDSVLLGTLAYNCGPGVVNKSTVLKKLKAGNRDIFKSYVSHCRYKGKKHKGLYTRRLTEFAALFIP